MASPSAPRRSEPHRLSGGEPTETLTRPCSGGCGRDVTFEAAPADTTFGDLSRAHPPACDTCSAKAEAEAAESDAAIRRELWDEDVARRLKAASIPPLFAGATFEKCRSDGMPEHAVAAAERWGAGEIQGLMLVGTVGVGKSTLAIAALRSRIERRNESLRWMSAPQMFAALASSFENETRLRTLGMLEGHKGLALDDIDKGRPTAYGAEMTYLAVDQRIVAKAPLLVTANSDLDALSTRWPEEYAEAIVSRLIGHCDLIAVDGSDRRLPVSAG
jgi:DNA replication protein DnaC